MAGNTELIPGAYTKVILTAQLQMKLQKKKKYRYSTKISVVSELRL